MVAEPGQGPPVVATVGLKVKSIRQDRQMTQRDLALALQVSPATMSQIENGKTGLSVSRLGSIATILGSSVQEILEHDPLGRKTVSTPAAQQDTRTATETPDHVRHDWRSYPPLDFDPILTSALQVILAVGYHGATLRKIAEGGGLSVPGLYHYYPSKQHILMHIMEATMTDLLARGRGARDEGTGPVERFCLLVEHLVLYHTHRRELGFVGAMEMRSLSDSNRDKIRQLRDQQQHWLDEEVRAAVDSNYFHNRYPMDTSRAIVTMCTALPNWWRPNGPQSPEQTARRYVDFALDLMHYTDIDQIDGCARRA